MSHENFSFPPLECMTVAEALESYPTTDPWLRTHATAQIWHAGGDKRLTSAEEKIAWQGGPDYLNSLYAEQIRRGAIKLPILRAFQCSPMYPLEVESYFLHLGHSIPPQQIGKEIERLGNAGFLKLVWDITYIARAADSGQEEAVWVWPHHCGVLTNSNGLHELNQRSRATLPQGWASSLLRPRTA